eukprot:5843594-Alexandrium_andersonii.AAC.1
MHAQRWPIASCTEGVGTDSICAETERSLRSLVAARWKNTGPLLATACPSPGLRAVVWWWCGGVVVWWCGGVV